MANLFNVQGKTVLVTGGSRGIGKAISLAFIEKGAKVIVIGKSDNIDHLKDEAQTSFGGDIDYIQCDLSDQDQVERLCIALKYEYKSIDILVSNAGDQERCDFLSYSRKQWDKDAQLLLTTPFQLSQAVAQMMIENKKGGKIIHMGSISGLQGSRNIVGYSTMKHALIGLVKCSAIELAPYNIQVNMISPGFIETDLLNKFPMNKDDIMARIPSHKIGYPDDIIGTVLYLSSSASNYVTGVNISVDGGWLSR